MNGAFVRKPGPSQDPFFDAVFTAFERQTPVLDTMKANRVAGVRFQRCNGVSAPDCFQNTRPLTIDAMNPTEQSLLAQMDIHEIEISRRKELLEFSTRDAELLASCREFILNDVDAIVTEFYLKQTAVNEIALIIGDADTLTRLRAAMTRYVIDLFSGFYDEAYVNNRLRIGLVHKRIGVAPKYYLSAMRILKSLLFDAITRRRRGQADCEEILQALDKLLYFDNEFVFDTYIRSLIAEIESAKDYAVRYARNLEDKVADRTRELAELSRRDSLTGLYNQRYMMEALRAEHSRARRSGQSLAVIYMDVDKFKEVNDSLGHLAGDEVLRLLGQTLAQQARSHDICCRYGGDEFCVVLPEASENDAVVFAERVLTHFQTLRPDIHLSVGVAVFDAEHDLDMDGLISTADQRMYAAKRQGGDRVN